ncbi:MAG: hypothetical protein QG639_997 [Patescibacteria group bacterium]|jgi:peptidoglycan/LPS O-acetylase OafA/YrhL|nr:hypothetical protein [Patescibacteria group bacterium]
MTSVPASTTSKRDTDTFLRGVAIVLVIVIHSLSSFKESPYITESPYQLWAVTLDQLARVAVPLFVALSGYGLMLKYQSHSLKWKEYLEKRVFKLLPLYILWSLAYWFIFLFIPQWRATPEMKPFFGQLLFGNADYHLYFVPMIFQLYLLFPFLLKLIKKNAKMVLLITGIFQLVLYVLISDKVTNQPGVSFFQSDQKQYIWFFSWIFYFVLGMCLPRIVWWINRVPWGDRLMYLLMLISGLIVSASALMAIREGTDPLVALRFTRWQVLLYASVATVGLFLLSRQMQRFPKWVLLIGEHSYVLYLSHTLWLRLLFFFINPQN